MILHLFNDEKVVNRCMNSFEKVFPEGNIFICFSDKKTNWVKPHPRLYYYSNDCDFDSSVLNSASQVIIHFLDSRKIDFVNKYIPQSIPCTWMVWGGDLYNDILVNRGYPVYYEPWFLGKVYLRILLCNILYKVGVRSPNDKLYLDFIKERITMFSTRTDYGIMQKYIGKYLNGRHVSGFSYYPVDVMLGDLKNSSVNGNVIMVGNSGGYTNNHTYGFKFLSGLDIGGRKILTPMGYGGSLKYRKHVEKVGRDIWGSAYQALYDFIPLDEYNRLMTSAEICVFSSWRQEAFGNVVVALYLGAKVFLSERSSLVEYFNKIGVKVFVLEEMTQADIDVTLSVDIKESNRRIILELLNEQHILESIKSIWGIKSSASSESVMVSRKSR